MQLNHRSFAYYNIAESNWTVDKGKCNILVGSSSRDIRQTAGFEVKIKIYGSNL
ncbi:MAG: hypothetical protein HC896_00610 [Bacteroidales bacterium]|nr:hypothetical protein [Bacteroidales bacterium]